MHMTVGNLYVIYSIVKRVSKRMRTLVGLCLTLVDVEQREDVSTDKYLACVLQTLSV